MLTNKGQRSGLSLRYLQSSFSGQNNSCFPTHKVEKLQKDFFLHIESEQGQVWAQRMFLPMPREVQVHTSQWVLTPDVSKMIKTQDVELVSAGYSDKPASNPGLSSIAPPHPLFLQIY